ncbi:MAG: glycerate kinase [Noviherbaspirillum sp.]
MTVIVVAPDSYKGSLSADAVARAIETGIRRVLPRAMIHSLAMADGGGATVEAVLAACSGELRRAAACRDGRRAWQCRSTGQLCTLKGWWRTRLNN